MFESAPVESSPNEHLIEIVGRSLSERHPEQEHLIRGLSVILQAFERPNDEPLPELETNYE